MVQRKKLITAAAAVLALGLGLTILLVQITKEGDSSSRGNLEPSAADGSGEGALSLPKIVAHGGTPDPEHFPLQLCNGDCDSDADCADGLVCFQRDPRDDVPGCSGGLQDTSRTDYCVPSDDEPPTAFPTDAATASPTGLPTALPTAPPTVSSSTQGNDLQTSLPTGSLSEIPSSTPSATASHDNASQIPSGLPSQIPTGASENPTVNLQLLPLQSHGEDPDPQYLPLERCHGNCGSDADCADGLVCFERNANMTVPGCIGGIDDASDTDYCIYIETTSAPTPTPTATPTVAPTTTPTVAPTTTPTDSITTMIPVTPLPSAQPSEHTPDITEAPTPLPILPLRAFGGNPDAIHRPLQRCRGDCDTDSDCDVGLKCFQRGARVEVPGCSGGSSDSTTSDYCVHDPNAPKLPPSVAPKLSPTVAPTSSPTPLPPRLVIRDPTTPILAICEGPCTSDSQCGDGSTCAARNAGDAVPGCVGSDSSDTNYCIAGNPPTYVPGHLTVNKHGLILSKGLNARHVATSGSTIKYANGQRSSIPFHGRPDGAATFADTDPNNEGGWIYVSNSEMYASRKAGVGGITFDKDGNTLGYKMLLEKTTHNCGGGRTPWNTWVSCEEHSTKGDVYQVDPLGIRPPQMVNLNGHTGKYESFAADYRDPNAPTFYITEDRHIGALTRLRPVRDDSSDWDADPWSMLHGTMRVDYLLLSGDGTYRWTSDRGAAGANAQNRYPNSEGIDVYENELFFVCKNLKMMYTLDLDGNSWFRESTKSGTFSGSPDQLQRILGDSRDLLYFTEEGSRSAGIHARDHLGNFYTVLEAPSLSSETTGLAVSPDGMYMMVAYQDDGHLFMIWRDDGHPFDGQRLDIKYHDA